MSRLLHRLLRGWDWFLFESCDPRIVPILRIGFALMVLIQTLIVWGDAAYWYTDAGVMQTQTAREILGPRTWSILYLLPSEPWVAKICLACLLVHSVLMLVGCYSRFQAAAIFVWLVSFQNRNPLINDGEDTVFRIFAFLMIWLPLDQYWSIRSRVVPSTNPSASQSEITKPIDRSRAWALRLIQVQMVAIYASTALSKLEGETWQDGTAVWYVSRMTDNFGRWISPSVFDWPWVSLCATYGTLVVEGFLPVALWIPKLRWVAIAMGVLLHLGIECSMNLFLFQWVMLLGLVAFTGSTGKLDSGVQEITN